MTDLEIFLLAWALIATFKAFEYGVKESRARGAFMHLVRDEKARNKMLADWEAFKKQHNITEGI